MDRLIYDLFNCKLLIAINQSVIILVMKYIKNSLLLLLAIVMLCIGLWGIFIIGYDSIKSGNLIGFAIALITSLAIFAMLHKQLSKPGKYLGWLPWNNH